MTNLLAYLSSNNFLLLSVILGGGAGYLAGRALAQTWRPLWQVVTYALILGGAVRFLHFALFQEPLLSAPAYCIDAATCLALTGFGYVVTRQRQMVTQYDWLHGGQKPPPSAE
ncbi:MAG TPA: hypothetical protein VL402_08475 [Xanthobacteraceae bacterium]|jgi:hypothetical protein|nr:hypothetical protein [Xanthobacteraceae bacterium]